MTLTEDGLMPGHLLQDRDCNLWQCWWPSERKDYGMPRVYYRFGKHLPVGWQNLPHPVYLVSTVHVGWHGPSIPVRTQTVEEIRPEDLQVNTFRNETGHSVRLVHTPTFLVSECGGGKSQQESREIALARLKDLLREMDWWA